MQAIFKGILFTSPVLLFILWYVTSTQTKVDHSISKKEAKMEKRIDEFDSEMAHMDAELADNETEKAFYLNKAKKAESRVAESEKEEALHKAKIKELQDKTDRALKTMDETIDKADKDIRAETKKDPLDF